MSLASASTNASQFATTTSAREKQVDAKACSHCGLPCESGAHRLEEKYFCCAGCRTVFELLTGNGLTDFYELGKSAGMEFKRPPGDGDYAYLDDPQVAERLVQFSSDRLTRITFRLPAIHCIACVWLLENLPRLNSAIGQTQVNFARKEVALAFDPSRIKLSEVAVLLTSLGYAPELNLSDLDGAVVSPVSRRLWLQLGLAGFAFGNIMLFSLPGYFGLDSFSAASFSRMFGWYGLLLAVPVLLFSASDYWRSAWAGLRQGRLTVDVPISIGLVALFGRSLFDVYRGAGVGFLDSLTGLTFFLLIGRVFQQKTYERLSFERDFRSFFPLAVTRKRRTENRVVAVPTEEKIGLAQLEVGDRLVIRNGELIPADSRLLTGPALIDYSFVTGESEPVSRVEGEHLYAGGRQIGGAIEVVTAKPVNQSYLTALWNQEAFSKEKAEGFESLTNRFSHGFTLAVILIAIAAGSAWWIGGYPVRALNAFASVLIVACPCALALAAPFSLGTALRMLGRRRIFLKGPFVVENLARIDTVVFDKTGTLTVAGREAVKFSGKPLDTTEACELFSITRHSTHPHAVRICEMLSADFFPEEVRSFLETPGKGIEARVNGREYWVGSARWLADRGVKVAQASCLSAKNAEVIQSTESDETVCSQDNLDRSSQLVVPNDRREACPTLGSEVHVAIDGKYRGKFVLVGAVRPLADRMMRELTESRQIALLSGDNDRESDRFSRMLGSAATLLFNQSPLNKLEYIHGLERNGRKVLMVGDGLNDAGALKQSDVGLAVVEDIGAFSPASDGIIAADRVSSIARILRYSRQSVNIVKAGLALSAIYNLVGLSLAIHGTLAPVFCAVFMPLSSISVVAFSTGLAAWFARRTLPRDQEVAS